MMVPQQQRRRRRRTALPRTSERRVIVARGAGGFGFTIAGQRPCVVSAVAAGGPAERAGLRAGDALLAVDGASVARAPHASVARLVAAAPGAIALSVAPRDAPPTDTEDTEPDERSRTRRRHPPPRRRPQAMLHHPACHAVPSTSGVNEILQNLSRAQLTPSHTARLECRAVVGYLGTIETPQAASTAAPGNVRNAVRKLRQERRPAAPVLLSVLPNALLLRRPTGQVLAQYQRERILYAGCGSDADRRYFGLVTSAEAEASHSCHVFAVDPRLAEHDAHTSRAREFQIACTRDPVAERCLEFPPSAEYVVGVIRGMFSLPPDDCISPTLQQISKLAVKGDSPALGNLGNFSRCNRGVFRVPRDRRPCRYDDVRIDGQEFVSNSPQPSNHSEMTTTSSNSDSGIGFHNDCRNIADRILVVDFAGQQHPPNRFRQEMPRRPVGLVGCSSFDADGSFLSNTTPVVDGFGGQGRPLNLDDVILNANDLQPVRHVNHVTNEDDNYNYNNVYGNVPSTSRAYNGVYDQVYENEGQHYELIQKDLEMERVVETFDSVEIYEDRCREYQSNESVENETVISGGTSKASMDSVSVYSSRSHEEARPSRQRHMQASLDDMLVLGLREPPPARDKDEGNFLHPSTIKFKVRKSMKPLNLLSKTKHMLTGKDRKEKDAAARRRAVSASAGDVCRGGEEGDEAEPLPTAASEPDLRDTQSDQSSPFRRWTTGSGGGSSYRSQDHRNLYNKDLNPLLETASPYHRTDTKHSTPPGYKERDPPLATTSAHRRTKSKQSAPPPGLAQMSEDNRTTSSITASPSVSSPGHVTQWSMGLEHLLADPVGAAAFAQFLAKEFANENIKFWWACEKYRMTTDAAKRSAIASAIWERYLGEGAQDPVNVDASARKATYLGLKADPCPPDLFETVQNQIFTVMKFDSYPRFLRSDTHSKSVREELVSRPSTTTLMERDAVPVLTDAEADTVSSPTRIRKSASNASERRRSGGSSLLPWRLRAGSRDRAAAGASTSTTAAAIASAHITATAITSTTAQTSSGMLVTDVVRSQQGQCSLCRVVLPDGATSVVGVERTVTVRRMVDRLLQRRNLRCSTYDVLINDCSNDQAEVIDVEQASTTVGGREIVVEQRCVVRIEVGVRCVAVRCRPSRRLRHVLRPVMARYWPQSPMQPQSQPQRAVLRDNTVLHPDTPMLELDGTRLQIVELSDGVGCLKISQDEEVDSLNDFALRLQEDGDDEQCNTKKSNRIRFEDQGQVSHAGASTNAVTYASSSSAVTCVTSSGLTCVSSSGVNCPSTSSGVNCPSTSSGVNFPSTSSGVNCPSTSSGVIFPSISSGVTGASTSTGRVRAALRQGAPLHHHPPDFLENLRETQRQRLQSKPSEPAPSPRTPPPLPPKPSQRTPTLV